jgi:tetratricopeptide (TPR) repeat protein
MKEFGLAQRLSQTISIITLISSLVLPAWAAADRPVAAGAAEVTPAFAVAAIEASAAAVVDPVNDPWLAKQGPAVPVPEEVSREQVLASWQNPSATPEARAFAARRVRLELGLGDLLAPAVTLLRSASEEQPEIYAQLARDLAPGVPSVQLSTASALWQSGDIGAAIHSLIDSAVAAAQHLEVQLWAVENFALILVVVVLGSSLAFMILSGLMAFPHAAHDLGDLLSSQTPAFARSAALAGLLLLPFVFGEGIVGLALVLFAIGFIYGKRPQRNALAMAAVLFVVGLHPASQLASVTTSLFEKDATLVSVFAVANGLETRADVERLRAASPANLAASHALAYHARRYGLGEEALRYLDEIATNHPKDGVMLANRGNVEMRRGNTERAIEYYKQAVGVEDSPTVLFDLSQAYAAAFQMESVEVTLARAQALDDEAVAALSSLEDSTVVADLGMPFGLLQKYLVTLALAQEPETAVAEALAPGRLGERWSVTAIAFTLVALVSILFANRFDRASVCTRCGHRICTRCEETVWSDDLCEDCHHLFQNPDETDPSLRMARLQSLSRREVWIDRIWTATSLLVPGVAGFASKRPDLAMFGLLLFAWAATWLVWPTGMLVDSMLLGSAAWIFFAIPGVLAMLAYFGVVLMSLVARKNL